MSEDTRIHEEDISAKWREAWDSPLLLSVIAGLYAQEINVGLQTFFDGGCDVWIGDDMNGRARQETFDRDSFGEIVQWLKLTAEEVYPILRRRRIGDLAYV